MTDMSLLKQYGAENGLTLTDGMLAAFSDYYELLLEWNAKFNLTAVTDKDEVIVKHFLDSLLAQKYFKGSVCDVGSGAGFPGIPLGIYREDLKLTLIDSLNKRVTFLTEAAAVCGVKAEALHLTSEEAAAGRLRESFDTVTARAVAPMSILLDLTVPLAKTGGRVVLYKGVPTPEEKNTAEELCRALSAVKSPLLRNILFPTDPKGRFTC